MDSFHNDSEDLKGKILRNIWRTHAFYSHIRVCEIPRMLFLHILFANMRFLTFSIETTDDMVST